MAHSDRRGAPDPDPTPAPTDRHRRGAPDPDPTPAPTDRHRRGARAPTRRPRRPTGTGAAPRTPTRRPRRPTGTGAAPRTPTRRPRRPTGTGAAPRTPTRRPRRARPAPAWRPGPRPDARADRPAPARRPGPRPDARADRGRTGNLRSDVGRPAEHRRPVAVDPPPRVRGCVGTSRVRARKWGSVARKGVRVLREGRRRSCRSGARRAAPASSATPRRGLGARRHPRLRRGAPESPARRQTATERPSRSSTGVRPSARSVASAEVLPADVMEEITRAGGSGAWRDAGRAHGRGRLAYERDRYTEALRITKALVDEVPGSASARELHGLVCYRLGRWRDAVRHLEAGAVTVGGRSEPDPRADGLPPRHGASPSGGGTVGGPAGGVAPCRRPGRGEIGSGRRPGGSWGARRGHRRARLALARPATCATPATVTSASGTCSQTCTSGRATFRAARAVRQGGGRRPRARRRSRPPGLARSGWTS